MTACNLSPLESKLLRVLSSAPGRILTRLEIYQGVYGGSWVPGGYISTVNTLISSLRRKMGKGLVKTVPNKGYIIDGG